MSARLQEGTVFADRYRIVRRLAQGGMGAVYEVVHLETERRHALKVMHAHLFQSEELRERFQREARITARIESEYIVEVSDAGVDEATEMPFLVMELLRGEELGLRLKRSTRLPPEEVLTYLQQVAWALERTHAASIVHRDLKPANLFLTTREDGTPRIKILDFGVAKVVADGATATGASESLGSPLYMAPEQLRPGLQLTPAADIHALTLLTYTLLVGRAYWADEADRCGHAIVLALAVIKGPPEPAGPRAARYGVTLPPGFDAWFARGTAVDPADRFGSATEAVEALRALYDPASLRVVPVVGTRASVSDPGPLTAESGSAHVTSPALERDVTTIGAPTARSRAPLVAATMLGLSVIGAAGWLLWRSGDAGAVPSRQPGAVVLSAAPAASVSPPVDVAPPPVDVVAAAPSVSAATMPTTPAAVASGARPVAVAKPAAPPAATVKKPRPERSLLGRD